MSNAILVTGADGQLGFFVQRELRAKGQAYDSVTLKDLDLSQKKSIDAFFKIKGRYGTILNLAAFTHVDQCESECALAMAINGEAPGLLGAYCGKLIQVSTDYVFDGESSSPYRETDPARPLSVYGESKLAGEKSAFAANDSAVVVRTSWLFSERPGNFLTKITGFAKEKPRMRIVADQRGTPTYAGDLAKVLIEFASRPQLKGLFHYSNEGETSWYEFADYFLKQQKISTPVEPIATSEYPLPARRPAYSVMDKTKIKNDLGIEIRDWKESVKLCLKNMS